MSRGKTIFVVLLIIELLLVKTEGMASAYVDNLISSHKVVVFSKSYCPYCTKAKDVLSKYNIDDIVIIELENRDDCDEIQDYLLKLTGARSVWQILILIIMKILFLIDSMFV